MRIFITLLILVLFASGIGYGASKKPNRPLDIGISASADPNIHQAVYAVLKDKGISCDGLSTRKDGIITIINPSSTKSITAAEINVELVKIKQAQDVEVKIEAEIRAMAIKSLVSKGEIPVDTK